ncbi:hypothetical protein MGSAQ_000240 [marine sediment metagenome]|uniref:Uncharacterized protein n=1 Tax=marine sediment metagenome TaxID=412755 RepID=A0A1B6NXY0_9ZZZZ
MLCRLTSFGSIFNCLIIQLVIRRSISSPPSALLPPVANTSKTPSFNFRIDTSKVPPPKS